MGRKGYKKKKIFLPELPFWKNNLREKYLIFFFSFLMGQGGETLENVIFFSIGGSILPQGGGLGFERSA